ncbi:highly divergent homeobox isoform X2 [Ambystoma mexicanum]|uniref:highly divergent homeobox isoform X2 n=1 Tax=Ambystoma mexicanum TaxID=8296 RepID=UPI0037E71118
MEEVEAPNVGEVTSTEFQGVKQETWVGNKRRKMSNKVTGDSGSSSQGSVSSAASWPPEVVVRNVPNVPRSQSQQPPPTSNSDVIVTGVYSPNHSSSRQGSSQLSSTSMAEVHKNSSLRPIGRNETEYQKQHINMQRQTSFSKNAMLLHDDKTSGFSRHSSGLNSANSMYTKRHYGVSSGQSMEIVGPQKTTVWPRHFKTEPHVSQRSYRPENINSNFGSHNSSGQRGSARDPSSGSTHNLEIRDVFSLAATEHSPRTFGERTVLKSRSSEGNCLSIAMETGDIDDEYAREEELASLGAQTQCYMGEYGNSSRIENKHIPSSLPVRTLSSNSQPGKSRDLTDKTLYHNRDYHLSSGAPFQMKNNMYNSANMPRSNFPPHYAASNQQRLPQNQNNYQISGNISVPWITECSRKRTLQDRTQFSHRDLATLKKYWDNGMTSLGSVCREKIEVVASELNVDCEIVRTWIGNRRRKYRLMGIEVPPPKRGPADFSDQLEAGTSSSLMSGDNSGLDGMDDDRNDDVSICLSEGSSQEEIGDIGRSEDIDLKEDIKHTLPTVNVKTEIIDVEESDGVSNSEVEQMRSLLEFKNEEVKCIENDLENQKHKYSKLQNFTRKLIYAVKLKDAEQQEALLSDLPPDLEDLEINNASSEPEDTSLSLSDLPENVSDGL